MLTVRIDGRSTTDVLRVEQRVLPPDKGWEPVGVCQAEA